MGYRIFNLDDSKMACNVMHKHILATLPDAEWNSFQDPKLFLKALEEESIDFKSKPFIVFTDLNIPQFNGMKVLSWIKRHPKFHFLPVVFVSAEGDSACVEEAEKAGAFRFLHKPIGNSDLEAIFKRIPVYGAEIEILQEIEANFPDESEDNLNEIQNLLQEGFSQNSFNSIYRAFHTLKGNAGSIQYPQISTFIHHVESFLKAVASLNLYTMPKAQKILLESVDYLRTQIQFIRKAEQIEVPPEHLEKDFQHFIELIDQNAETPLPGATSNSPVAQAVVQKEIPANGVVSKTAQSVRIANAKLDDIQKLFKSIMQTRVKITRFAHNLKSEFSDEGFPNELIKLCDALTGDTTNIMDFFISLRIVSARRIENYVNMTASKTAATLGKTLSLEIEIPESAEIDQYVCEELENCLGHIVRNCIDHGIESPEDRVKAGKAPEGLLKLTLSLEDKDTLNLNVRDDGRGINTQKLKEKLSSTGLMTENSMENLKEEQLLDLIFMDNLSTKDSTSELSGRGVGMAAVKESIEKLGGKISVTSTLGEGTEFQITVPRLFKL